jgi:plasmid stabilization system protein ParE
MRVLYTAAALRDLDEIAEWLVAHYPRRRAFDRAPNPRCGRPHRALAGRCSALNETPWGARHSDWPLPYRIFYRITDDAVEILHIHHAARRPWDEQE